MLATGDVPQSEQHCWPVRARARLCGDGRSAARPGGLRANTPTPGSAGRRRVRTSQRLPHGRDPASDDSDQPRTAARVTTSGPAWDEGSETVLKRRAEQLAKLPVSPDSGDEVEVLVCLLGTERYAVETRH